VFQLARARCLRVYKVRVKRLVENIKQEKPSFYIGRSALPIIDATAVFAELRNRHPGIEIRDYSFRRLYSTERMIFFDCDCAPEKCLTDALAYVDYPRFVAYAVVEDVSGHRYVMDISYANLGKETLERFVKRYPGQLRPSSEMALQLSDRKYVEYIGASYED
jgi:hypothetical protein